LFFVCCLLFCCCFLFLLLLKGIGDGIVICGNFNDIFLIAYFMHNKKNAMIYIVDALIPGRNC
jgi:hypothetical protein